MENNVNNKTTSVKYKCAICGKEYETIVGRNKCETDCLNKLKKVETQKADTIRIKSLINDYIETLTELKSLVDTINSETQMYYQNYNMLYAPKDLEDKLFKSNMLITNTGSFPNTRSLVPDLVKFDSPLYANESAIHTFTTYESTLHNNKNNEPSEFQKLLNEKVESLKGNKSSETQKDCREDKKSNLQRKVNSVRINYHGKF